MNVPYVCCTKRFEEHYNRQSGSGIAYYNGVPLQRGYGLGGIFRRLFRSALPFLIRGAKTVGKEALLAGTRVANDVLSGENLKSAAKQRTRESGRTLAQKAVIKAQSMLGSGKHKKKRKAPKLTISKRAKKVRGRDIFDP